MRSCQWCLRNVRQCGEHVTIYPRPRCWYGGYAQYGTCTSSLAYAGSSAALRACLVGPGLRPQRRPSSLPAKDPLNVGALWCPYCMRYLPAACPMPVSVNCRVCCRGLNPCSLRCYGELCSVPGCRRRTTAVKESPTAGGRADTCLRGQPEGAHLEGKLEKPKELRLMLRHNLLDCDHNAGQDSVEPHELGVPGGTGWSGVYRSKGALGLHA